MDALKQKMMKGLFNSATGRFEEAWRRLRKHKDNQNNLEALRRKKQTDLIIRLARRSGDALRVAYLKLKANKDAAIIAEEKMNDRLRLLVSRMANGAKDGLRRGWYSLKSHKNDMLA